jgi:hypothetical protein
MIEILEEIARDPETNPTAKCTAIRTLVRIWDDRTPGTCWMRSSTASLPASLSSGANSMMNP